MGANDAHLLEPSYQCEKWKTVINYPSFDSSLIIRLRNYKNTKNMNNKNKENKAYKTILCH